MADYFLYHNLEEGRENKVCLYFEDQTCTYGETARMSNRAGNALRELGLEMEDRVLIVLPDCPEFVWTWFGAARIGAVITMVNPLLPAEDYKYYLEYTRARVAVDSRIVAASVSPKRRRGALSARSSGGRRSKRVTTPTSLTTRSAQLTSKLRTSLSMRSFGSAGRVHARRHASRRHRDLVVHFRFDRSSQRRGAPATRLAFQHRSLCQSARWA